MAPNSLTLIVGCTGGLGTALTEHLLSTKEDIHILGTCRKEKDSITNLKKKYPDFLSILPDTDLTDENVGQRVVDAVRDAPHELATIYFIAGVLKPDSLEEPNPESALLMYKVCALGPLMITSALCNAGMLKEGVKIGLLTSEGGSIGLRQEKEGGGSYGHHLSKAAGNMLGKLLSLDLKSKGVPVVNLHPGFMKTSMTEPFSDKYDELGAVEPPVAAKGIAEAMDKLTLTTTGRFVSPLGSESLGFGAWGLDGTIKPFGDMPW